MSIFICVMPMLWHQQIDMYRQLTAQKGVRFFGARNAPELERTPFKFKPPNEWK